MRISTNNLATHFFKASCQQKLGKALNALCPLKDQRWKVGGPREGSGGAVREGKCAATVGNKAYERGEGCVSSLFKGGGGAPIDAQSWQSSLGVIGLPVSSPEATSFIIPELVQTSMVDSGLTRGEAIATPKDKANHTSTRRAI